MSDADKSRVPRRNRRGWDGRPRTWEGSSVATARIPISPFLAALWRSDLPSQVGCHTTTLLGLKLTSLELRRNRKLN